MPIHNLDEVKAQATRELAEEDFKVAVKAHKERLKIVRKNFLPWKIRLRWPVAMEDHFPILNRRRGDRGKTT